MSAEHPHHRRSHIGRKIVFGLVLVLAAGLIGLMAWQMMAGTKSTKKQNPQNITMIKPLPPPPPPPPPKEKPPEVKKEEVKVEEKKVEQPKDDQQQPESKPLGVDADGSAGGDDFGLQANRGGRDITTLGGDNAGSRNRQGYYAGIVQRHIQDALQRDKRLRGQEYRAVVHVWFREDGTVQRSQVVGSSGKPETDTSIVAALAESPPLRESLPGDLPQPVKLRVTSRL